MRKINVIFIVLLLSFCSVKSVEKEFINQVIGTYQLKNSSQLNIIDNQGTIYQDGKILYVIQIVKSSDYAIYRIVDPLLGTGYVPVVYKTAILYIGDLSPNVDNVNIYTVKSYGIRVT